MRGLLRGNIYILASKAQKIIQIVDNTMNLKISKRTQIRMVHAAALKKTIA